MKPLLGALLLLSWLLLSCNERPARERTPRPEPPPLGNALRGHDLVGAFECGRCHEGLGHAAIPIHKSCVGCHRAQSAFPLGTPAAARIQHFVDVPSLAGSTLRLRRGWVERFLLEPHDLRPALDESMPRLALDVQQARDIAAYLAPDDFPALRGPRGDPAAGRRLLDRKGCGTCHRFSGVPALQPSAIPVHVETATLARAVKLAPDLRWARERLLPGYLEEWLRRPSKLRSQTLMPDIPLTRQEIRDIASYLLTAPLTLAKPAPFTKLPLLTRRVRYAEVEARIFRKTCRHCHSDPDYAIGDGGPGNTGGFGFRGRGINLAEYETTLAGFIDDTGRRQSLLRADEATGQSRLVRALLARHAEQAGSPDREVRGMPLGLPALPAEEIQLVESWIAQGRPR